MGDIRDFYFKLKNRFGYTGAIHSARRFSRTCLALLHAKDVDHVWNVFKIEIAADFTPDCLLAIMRLGSLHFASPELFEEANSMIGNDQNLLSEEAAVAIESALTHSTYEFPRFNSLDTSTEIEVKDIEDAAILFSKTCLQNCELGYINHVWDYFEANVAPHFTAEQLLTVMSLGSVHHIDPRLFFETMTSIDEDFLSESSVHFFVALSRHVQDSEQIDKISGVSQFRKAKISGDCFNCYKPGHIAANCKELPRDDFNKRVRQKKGSVNSKKKIPSIYMNYGILDHMFNDKSAFVDLSPCATHIIKSDNGRFTSSSKGSVILKSDTGKCYRVNDVYYVPDCNYNHVSVPKAIYKGANFSLNRKAIFDNNSKEIIGIHQKNGILAFSFPGHWSSKSTPCTVLS